MDVVPGTALAQFATAHSTGLTRFAFVLCGDRGIAEDLVQDTFLSMYRRFGDTLPIEAPVAYARRAIINANASRMRRRAGSERPLALVPDGPAPDAVDHGEQDAMWRVLATLPERQRTVLVLRYYADLADRDIAAAMDCAEGTVRSLAARGFETLRTHAAFSTRHGEIR